MSAKVVSESSVHFFKFYLDEKVREGLRWQFHMYGLVSAFDQHSPHSAYNLADELTKTGRAVLVTAADECYKVWVRLSAIDAPSSELLV